MKRFMMLLVVFLLSTGIAAGATDTITKPKACKQCAMDLDYAARSRMLVVYNDGTTVAICSLHCAVEEMKQNSDRPVKSIMVADYATEDMIDARTATWVV